MPQATTATHGIERVIVATGLGYPDLVQAFERELPRLEPALLVRLVERHAAWEDVAQEIGALAGPHGLTIIAQANQGPVVSLAGKAIRSSLYLIGNPVIAAGILAIDVRASLYVPLRIALYDDGGGAGASIAFDRPSSALASLGRPELAPFGTLLDQKLDRLADAICRPPPRK
jgi:Domain of unknown function DUF302